MAETKENKKMSDKEFLKSISDFPVEIINGDEFKLNVKEEITSEQLVNLLKIVYDYEQRPKTKTLFLNLKSLNTDLKASALKYALSRDDLKDPVTSLNIFNLIKIYNTLDDSFFEDENVWVNSLEDLLDLKLEIHDELKAFVKQFSIYFLSLIKSYNKMVYTPLDNHIDLPQSFKTLFLSMDFMTASGIFSISEPINTEDLTYINDATPYLMEMMVKNCMGIGLLNAFLEKKEGFFKRLYNKIMFKIKG